MYNMTNMTKTGGDWKETGRSLGEPGGAWGRQGKTGEDRGRQGKTGEGRGR